MSPTLKVLLADDDWSVRTAVRDHLVKHGMTVIEADCLEAALVAVEANPPDVAVLDIVLPERPGQRPGFERHVGVELARRLHERWPDLGIVFLSAYVDRGPEVVKLYMEGHARIAYLLKGSKPQELLEAIHKITGGTTALQIDPSVPKKRTTGFELALATLTVEERSSVELALAQLPALSEPERRVFETLGACRTHKQAADELGLSAKTVSSHLEAIYEKLGLREAHPGLNQAMILAKLYTIESLKKANST